MSLTRVLSANDMHVMMTACLDTARDIHIAMALFDDNHTAQARLNDALHSALVGAEMCRQIHKSAKHRLAPEEPEDDSDH